VQGAGHVRPAVGADLRGIPRARHEAARERRRHIQLQQVEPDAPRGAATAATARLESELGSGEAVGPAASRVGSGARPGTGAGGLPILAPVKSAQEFAATEATNIVNAIGRSVPSKNTPDTAPNAAPVENNIVV